jgi:hypothetical protein
MFRSVLSAPSLTALCCAALVLPAAARADQSEQEVRATVQEAYVYGFPLVDDYRVLYSFAVDAKSPEFKAPFNAIRNEARVFTPADKTVQTPNSDTPYSFAALDLRAEPIVLTLPAVTAGRYYSVQLVDLYTYNFAYLGTRTTGNGGGSFAIAGPDWKGEMPKGVQKVIRADTELALAIYRTQLFDAADMANVKKIQAGYKVQTLSAFLGLPAPPPAPKIDFIPPPTPKEEQSSPRFFDVLAFVLKLCPTLPTEKALRERFEKIGIVPGKPFDLKDLSNDERRAFVRGMIDAEKQIAAERAKATSSSGFFGSREYLGTDYLKRAVAAQMGIYGNSREEAFYVPYQTDSAGVALDGAKQRYTLHFAKDALPPVEAFWSLTMYDLPDRMLVANPLSRYLINSTMLPKLKHDADGGITLYLQSESPGKPLEPNWLPAPKGAFFAVLRLYLPKPAVLDGQWKAPALEGRAH